ncbi:MAG: AAA family ATPase [Chloroflexi bacterium]|nr:AAA family ATPase [Chloroflexota bacterium]
MSPAPTYKPLEIEVTDFGPIARAKLDLRPLTVFVGPSNTGKSYLATLIYALHRFFGGYANSPNLSPKALTFYPLLPFHRVLSGVWMKAMSATERDTLIDWVKPLLVHAREEEFADDFRASVPDAVAVLFRPLLRDVSDLDDYLEREIARCFGIESLARLVRHGSRDGARVVLKRYVAEPPRPVEPFTHEFTIRSRKSIFTASIPDATPLQIERNDGEPWYQEKLRLMDSHISLYSDLEGSSRESVASVIRDDVADVVGTCTVSPLNRVAHYLPADRAGVMHAHRAVMTSLIRQAPHGGPHRSETAPTLSGVLADFLEQLVAFGDSPREERSAAFLEEVAGLSISLQRACDENRFLAATLEAEILKGTVHHRQSITGYPVFSYQPQGRREEVPLLNASSMVSELAPVVLYLRYLVYPGDVLIIEEPEAHLHPAMQRAFTRQLAAAVRAGVRVMITTHSDYVLEELANLVRMSELPETRREGLMGADVALNPDEVGVWLFEPKKRPKGSVVKEIPLDADVGLYSAGYGDVTEALYNTSVEIDSRIGESKTGYESR